MLRNVVFSIPTGFAIISGEGGEGRIVHYVYIGHVLLYGGWMALLRGTVEWPEIFIWGIFWSYCFCIK